MRWKQMESATPFGTYVLQRMHACHLTKRIVSSRLGILPDHFDRVLVSPHAAIELPLLKKLSEILEVSWVELSLKLYNEGSGGVSATDMGAMLLFDQYYRLSPENQAIILEQTKAMLQVSGERPLTPEQEKNLASLRLAPTCVKRGGLPRRRKSASA